MQPCSCGVAHEDSFGPCPITVSQSPMQKAQSESSLDKPPVGPEVVEIVNDHEVAPADKRPQTSTLIEFPGVTRPVPEWRKHLSQRVREVQERRARETAEAAAADPTTESLSCALPSAQLELVPDLEQPVMNPIVTKALERVERAKRTDYVGGFAAAAAPALATDVLTETSDTDHRIETRSKLVVVGPEKKASPAELKTDQPKDDKANRKPVRLITGAVNDAALSYLENYLSIPALASDAGVNQPGLTRRVVAGILDLFLMALMAAPFAAAIEFVDANWFDPQVVAVISALALVFMFAYQTISIAMTGRTWGMRLLSLRTIDMRTGLIPTGGQSIKRALGYIFSLTILGIGLIYALVDPDGRTVHDRFSKTLVIHD